MKQKVVFFILLLFTWKIVYADVFPFFYSRHWAWCQPGTPNSDVCSSNIVGSACGLTLIGGSGNAVPTDVQTHMARTAIGSASGSRNGWTAGAAANACGAMRLNFDMVWKGGIRGASGGGDDAIFRLGIGWAGTLPVTFDALTCGTGGNVDNMEGFWFCFQKSVQANWLACSGDGADWRCTDTGVAGPLASGKELFMLRIDARDPTSIKYYAATSSSSGFPTLPTTPSATRTTFIPAANSANLVQMAYSMRTTAASSGGLEIGLAFRKWTWD